MNETLKKNGRASLNLKIEIPTHAGEVAMLELAR